jgi:prepilin-type N-terminal cleavage/methylation domain-containing protein
MKKNNKNKGFTLAEIVVVVGIFGIIVLAISSFQVNVLNNNKYAQDSLSSAFDARNILRVMVKELRGASPGIDGSFAITTAATNTIAFYSDVDGDGVKDKVRYYIATSTLRKGYIKPTGNPPVYSSANEVFITLASNIKNATSSPLFEYFDSNYAGTSTPLTQPVTLTNVHLVKINLLIDADPNKSPNVRTYTSQVNLRNLKDNL